MAVQPPWPPGQLTDGELERRHQELQHGIASLPPASGRADALRDELDRVEAERQAPCRQRRRAREPGR